MRRRRRPDRGLDRRGAMVAGDGCVPGPADRRRRPCALRRQERGRNRYAVYDPSPPPLAPGQEAVPEPALRKQAGACSVARAFSSEVDAGSRQENSSKQKDSLDARPMNLRLLAMALCALAIVTPSSAQTPDLASIARGSGTPEIPGLKMVWLAPWGDVAKAHPWKNIIVHQTEGPAGSARGGAGEQTQNPNRRRVTVLGETDRTVDWSVAGDLVPV